MFKRIAQFCAKIKLYFIKQTAKTISDDDLKEIYQLQMKKILATEDIHEMSRWCLLLQVFHVFSLDHREKDKTYPCFMSFCKKIDPLLESYKSKTESEKFDERLEKSHKKHREIMEEKQKNGERDRFNNSWTHYWGLNRPQPTAEDFKNYLVEKQGLTEEQIDEIKVSAIFVDNNITNFNEFYDEIGRIVRG